MLQNNEFHLVDFKGSDDSRNSTFSSVHYSKEHK
jgi:hypothetical protein